MKQALNMSLYFLINLLAINLPVGLFCFTSEEKGQIFDLLLILDVFPRKRVKEKDHRTFV